MLEQGASDLHLTAGAKPTVRVHGRLGPLEDYPVLQPAETQAMIYSTVEDPIEFLHSHKRCLVNQRKVGEDTRSFAVGRMIDVFPTNQQQQIRVQLAGRSRVWSASS